jgi:DnaK suppressor protein
MTKVDLNIFKGALETKQTELQHTLRRRDGITIEPASDQVDLTRDSADRELHLRNLDRDSITLRNVQRALRRVDAGNFGVCQHCEEDISSKRLAAIPWTPYCVKCQELADRSSNQGLPLGEALLAGA